MIQISEEKMDKMSDLTEAMLRAGGQLMSCLDELSGGDGYGNRSDDERWRREEERRRREMDDDYGNRYDGGRYGGDGYGNRRGVPGSGRRRY